MSLFHRLRDIVRTDGAAALVSVHAVKGSAPRGVGARMGVRPDGAFHGTIGGGRLEWEALAEARRAIASGERRARFAEQVLGPDLGQCCGGVVTLLIEVFERQDAIALAELARLSEDAGSVTCRLGPDGRVDRAAMGARAGSWRETLADEATPLCLFGAGHVGRALVLALAPLPFAVRWIDARPDAFPAHIPANVAAIRASDPVAAVSEAMPGSFVVVMTHDHALDLALVGAALGRGDLPFVGLIGSTTKRARFERRLRAAGLAAARIAALICPIGLPAIEGKEPAVIAASIAAQLLERRSALARSSRLPEIINREAS